LFEGTNRTDHCIVSNTQAQSAVDVIASDTGSTDIGWFECDYNAYDMDKANPFNVTILGVVTSHDFADWQTTHGKDANSIEQAITFVNPTYDLVDHSIAEGGPATESGFIDALRNRGLLVWSDLYDAEAAYGNFAAAYAPTNLPAIDLSPDGYYGHYDYREGLPIFFTISGPSALDIDEEGTYTITPSAAPDDTVDLLDDGTPAGAFMPSLITWTGTAQDSRTFIYTPAEAGARVITAEIDSTIVATKTVTVTDPEEPPIPPVGLVASTEWRW
jgi:hypothetical protein